MYLRTAIAICSLCSCMVYEPYEDTGTIIYTDSVVYYIDTETEEFETDTLIYGKRK